MLEFFARGHGRTASALGRARAVTEFCGSRACVFRGAAGGNHPSRDLPVSFYSCLSFAESIQLELSLEAQCPGPAHSCSGSPEEKGVFTGRDFQANMGLVWRENVLCQNIMGLHSREL